MGAGGAQMMDEWLFLTFHNLCWLQGSWHLQIRALLAAVQPSLQWSPPTFSRSPSHYTAALCWSCRYDSWQLLASSFCCRTLLELQVCHCKLPRAASRTGSAATHALQVPPCCTLLQSLAAALQLEMDTAIFLVPLSTSGLDPSLMC